MIERYAREKMKAIWTLENKFKVWLDVEIAACEAHAKLGNIPKDAVKTIKKKAAFSVDRIAEIEATTHHDVIAFLTNVAENVGPESRHIHLGLTSSDVVDTAFSVLIKQSAVIIRQDIVDFMAVIKKKAYDYKDTLMMGRTHGVHAEPMTLGLKFALWYEEMKRHLARFDAATKQLNVGQISGAVGNYANIDPEVESHVCQALGLDVDPISTQIVQRDRHAHFMTTLALIAGSLEKFATEVRALQKTETNELEEGFSQGQKGSSAMPHKRNPITMERITGLARVIRGNSLVSLENIALWHERDISHSSTERIIFPDSLTLLDYMFNLFINKLKNIVVHEDQMLENLDLLGGVVFSQRLLLAMVEKGLTREEAYAMVQKKAMLARDKKLKFRDVVLDAAEIKDIVPEQEIKALFDYQVFTRHSDLIFQRVFK